jgi:GT2 family glycosyltransferase
VQQHPAIKIIKNNANFGFAQGYNEALKHIDAEICYNSDISYGKLVVTCHRDL